MIQLSKFSVVAFCALVGLSATTFAQDSKPAEKPESKAATRLLFSVLTQNGEKRSLETHSYDLAKNKSSSLLATPEEYYVLTGVSPNQKTMVLYHRSKA
ncbi:MAG: hypothetical protein P1V97_37335, partial [Planctomycetota bacterium]|nr:hypothetical protein [Planctomycetota bacterium]